MTSEPRLPAEDTETIAEPVDLDAELQHIREDITAVGGMAALAFLPAIAFIGIALSLLKLPWWFAAVLGITAVLAHRLYAGWRIDRSALPVVIADVVQSPRRRRHMLIIAAVVIVASELLRILAPLAWERATGW